jgi:predicted DNA-binding antitoxin AbrB/MazE fold protein
MTGPLPPVGPRREKPRMPITIQATYEAGVLKPDCPLPLRENESVQITLELDQNWVQRSIGLLPWTGDAEELRQLIAGPELDPVED